MFQLRFKGSPLKGKETNNTYQGKDIALSLYWAHKHNEWRIFGELQSEIIGQKKITQVGGELETVDAYSRFGTMVGGQWISDKFWLEAHTLFYLTTDYNSRSKSYNRITDKGYVIGAKFIVGFYLNHNSTITIEHGRTDGNFNIVSTSTTEATDYEMEIQYSQLGVTWLF